MASLSSRPSIRLIRAQQGPSRPHTSIPTGGGDAGHVPEQPVGEPLGYARTSEYEVPPALPGAQLARDGAPNVGDGNTAAESPEQTNIQRSIPPRRWTFWPAESAQRRRASTMPSPVTAPSRPRGWTFRRSPMSPPNAGEFGPEVVDILDVVDPEVSTITTLTNVQNSLMVPDLGTWINRRPSYLFTPQTSTLVRGISRSGPDGGVRGRGADRFDEQDTPQPESTDTESQREGRTGKLRFAVLPDDISLKGWNLDEMYELDDHVRHMLHSRRSKFKRSMKGFWKYVQRPVGFLVTLYFSLITLFGLAWVLFLIGWINVGGRQLYAIEVIDQVLVALFAVVGWGFAPFRAVDTYHMVFIARYHFLTWKLRRKMLLPKLRNKNDLPMVSLGGARVRSDIEEIQEPDPEYSVLTPKQQRSLIHHQSKFAKSHTFYKPHETTTHHAFPIRFLIAIVVLLDFHSVFQVALGLCTWTIDYRVRPFAVTTVLLCCSLSCNTAGGILITIGDRRTRKKEVIEKMHRQELTKEAVSKVRKSMDRGQRDEEQNEGRASGEFGKVESGA